MGCVSACGAPSRPRLWRRWCRPFWRECDDPAHPATPYLCGHRARRLPQGHRWTRRRVPPAPGRQPACRCRLRLSQPLGHRPQALAVRRPRLLALSEATLPGALCVVAPQCGRTRAPVGSSAADFALEWPPGPGPDGPGLATGGLRRGAAGGIGPRQPRCRVHKHLMPMLLQRHQVLYGIDTGREARGNPTGEHTGNGGAVRVLVK